MCTDRERDGSPLDSMLAPHSPLSSLASPPSAALRSASARPSKPFIWRATAPKRPRSCSHTILPLPEAKLLRWSVLSKTATERGARVASEEKPWQLCFGGSKASSRRTLLEVLGTLPEEENRLRAGRAQIGPLPLGRLPAMLPRRGSGSRASASGLRRRSSASSTVGTGECQQDAVFGERCTRELD